MKGPYSTRAELLTALSTAILAQLSAVNIAVPSSMSVEDKAESALEALGEATGFYPFCVTSDANPSTFAVDIQPNGAAFFRCGVVSSEDVALAVGATALTAATDDGITSGYTLRRSRSDPSGPYTWADGLRRRCGRLSVTGLVGYGTTIPEGAFQCAVDMAMLSILPYMLFSQSGGVAEFAIGNGDLRVKFEAGKGALQSGVEEAVRRSADRYRLKGL